MDSKPYRTWGTPNQISCQNSLVHPFFTLAKLTVSHLRKAQSLHSRNRGSVYEDALHLYGIRNCAFEVDQTDQDSMILPLP
jgi:hypothetical protein